MSFLKTLTIFELARQARKSPRLMRVEIDLRLTLRARAVSSRVSMSVSLFRLMVAVGMIFFFLC